MGGASGLYERGCIRFAGAIQFAARRYVQRAGIAAGRGVRTRGRTSRARYEAAPRVGSVVRRPRRSARGTDSRRARGVEKMTARGRRLAARVLAGLVPLI